MHERQRLKDRSSLQKASRVWRWEASHNQYGILEWMIKIKRQKDLIKGEERVICVRQNSTNEKRGVFEKESHIEICTFECREKGFLFNFYFLFHRKERFKWGFYLIKREQVLLI